MEVPVSENDFKNKTVEVLADVVYKKASEDYQMKLKVMKEKAFPIIENVYNQKGSLFKNIQVPFSDGHTAINVVTDLKEAYDTQ